MKSIEEIVGSDNVNHLTGLGEKRYAVSQFDRTSEVCKSFDDLPLDPYCGEGRGELSGGKHRFRRYDDFKMEYCYTGRCWKSELLPHRPFIQSPKFNYAVGGIERHLEHLLIDPSAELNSLFNAFGFDKNRLFHAKTHQIRVVVTKDIYGVSVVEGPHRDGQDWQIVAVFDRQNIEGGQSQFLPNGGGEPFFSQTLKAGYAICNEDAAMWHNATDIFLHDGATRGYRNIWIIATNRWECRKYGDEFESAALRDGKAVWQLKHPDECPEIEDTPHA